MGYKSRQFSVALTKEMCVVEAEKKPYLILRRMMLFERHETYESNERQERVNLIRIAIVKYFMVTCMVYIFM